MKKMIIIIVCLILLCGCGNVAKEYRATYKTISLKETKKLYKEGNTQIIDVRSEKAYNKKHIKGATNIPYDDINDIINMISKDEIVIIYGASKKESKKASYKVIDMGYSLVYDLGAYK